MAREGPDRSHPSSSDDDALSPRDGARGGHLRASAACFSRCLEAARLSEPFDPHWIPQRGRHGDPSVEGPPDRVGPFAVPAEDRVLAGNGLRHPVQCPCSRTRLAWPVRDDRARDGRDRGTVAGQRPQGTGPPAGVFRRRLGRLSSHRLEHADRPTAGRRDAVDLAGLRPPLHGVASYRPDEAVHDFGEPRTTGGFHPHEGNDIHAPLGRPIRAPFPGLAVPHIDDWLAGRSVGLVGAEGFVRNAHLSRFGHLGYVRAGTVIGYVGDTGDALSFHDHFEWHPWVVPDPLHVAPSGYSRVRTAIDPFPFLNHVCR
ncbi:MAG: M23 family metallopeptidase [Actinobacteria bacterium]|nr:MAG: M23 family metallopeptidase [Actinomycetota bacterium]